VESLGRRVPVAIKALRVGRGRTVFRVGKENAVTREHKGFGDGKD
jgi:hypothetical protein